MLFQQPFLSPLVPAVTALAVFFDGLLIAPGILQVLDQGFAFFFLFHGFHGNYSFLPARSKVNIIATYNLALNASILASEGVGYALCFDKLFNVTGDSNLCFRPLKPAIRSKAVLIWKKYQLLGKAQQKFLELLDGIVAEED